MPHQRRFRLWKVPDGTTTADITEKTMFGVGADQDSDMRVVQRPFSPGIEQQSKVTLDTAGTCAVNCFVLSGDAEGGYAATVFTVTPR